MEERRLTKADIDKVRGIEGFPIAKDEDIIALSRPPYYTACPNPFIEEFIRENGTPYDEATDDYHREPFAADVSEGKNDPIYNAHTYHTKVPYKAIMRYILHYTKPGDIVFDGFSGSGMTGVAAQMCGSPEMSFKALIDAEMPDVEWGVRNSIINDLASAADYIAANHVQPFDFEMFSSEAAHIHSKVKEEYGWMYETEVETPYVSLLGDKCKATLSNMIWSAVLICPSCSKDVVLYDTGGNNMMIDISFNYWQNQMDEKHDYHGKSLKDEDCKNLADALRGDFNFVPPLSARYEQIKEKMCRLTDEQYQVLEDHAENDHQLIRGSAGTGKTLLAVEQCRRETLEGKKVLYVCYNQYIAQSVRECVQVNGPQFDVFTLHALMMHLSGEKGTGYLSSDYFDKLLPRFLAVDVRDKYDTVILDEGQDLFREKYMKCLDRVIKGGIRDGRWAFYYDRNQNVYGENEEMDSVLDSFSAFSPAKHTLSVNCRNTMQICDLNRALTGIEQAKRLKIDGKEVTLREYRSLDDEMEQLISDLEDLKEKGIDNSSIVILSPWKKNDPGCCLSRGMIPGRLGKLKTDKPWSAGKNEYRFCTVNTFKGLEADVIMLLDTDSYFDEKRRMQNYVAISRAKVDLYIYCSEDSKAERTKMMLQNMKARQ